MICNQLVEFGNLLSQLHPIPSNSDVTRIVCGHCQRLESCPNLSIEQVEGLEPGGLAIGRERNNESTTS